MKLWGTVPVQPGPLIEVDWPLTNEQCESRDQWPNPDQDWPPKLSSLQILYISYNQRVSCSCYTRVQSLQLRWTFPQRFALLNNKSVKPTSYILRREHTSLNALRPSYRSKTQLPERTVKKKRRAYLYILAWIDTFTFFTLPMPDKRLLVAIRLRKKDSLLGRLYCVRWVGDDFLGKGNRSVHYLGARN